MSADPYCTCDTHPSECDDVHDISGHPGSVGQVLSGLAMEELVAALKTGPHSRLTEEWRDRQRMQLALLSVEHPNVAVREVALHNLQAMEEAE